MKLSFNWLNDFVKHGLSPEKLAERLTDSGHEVKGIEPAGSDRVFEIEITPNRPDCLNTLGLAREVGAIVGKAVKIPAVAIPNIPKTFCDVTIEDKAGCSRYIGYVIEDIEIGEAPSSIKERLASLGLRPINNVVDITNFGLFENGQPLHAFDYDKLIGGKIIVRRAKAGEKIITLDGVERELNPSILVIADAERPVAVAGIMGGLATEVTASTKRILLESAYFDPVLIRRAGRALGLASDSSYRFERGVDFENVGTAAKRALGRICEMAGGKPARFRDVISRKPAAKKSFSIDAGEIGHFLGADISTAKMKAILNRLDFKVGGKGPKLSVAPPGFRNDIKQPVDVAEEVARIIGYDRLPTSLPQVKPSAVRTAPPFELKRKFRRVLTGLGLDEAISYPLINAAAVEKTKVSVRTLVRVKNPLSLDQEILRPSLLASLLPVISVNFNRGQKNLRLFELGKVYLPEGEKEVLAIVLTGQRPPNWQTNKKEPVDFFDLKGLVSRVFESLNLGLPQFEPMAQGAGLVIGKTPAGSLIRVGKDILKNWDVKIEDVFYAEIDLEAVYKIKAPIKHFSPLPEFPSIIRDVSVAVRQDIPFSRIEALVRQTGGSVLVAVNFLEQYLGEKIASGQKGLVFSLVYQSPERTLTESQIAPVHEKVVQKLVQDLGAVIR